MRFLYKIFIALLLLIFSSCQSATKNDAMPLMEITGPLARSVDALSGTLSVYSVDQENNNTPIKSADLYFFNGSNGLTVASPVVYLKGGKAYRFVLVINYNDVPIAYVDITQVIAATGNDKITFTQEQLNLTGIRSDISADQIVLEENSNILPDLDRDDDGYSNYIEVLAGSNPNLAESIPQGPSISNFILTLSSDANQLAIDADVADGNGIKNVDLHFYLNGADADYLKSSMQSSLSGNPGDLARHFTAVLNPQYALGELTVVIQAVSELNLTTQKEAIVLVKSNGQNLPPLISWNLLNGQTVDGTILIALSARDDDGLTLLSLDNPAINGVSDLASGTYQVEWRTEDYPDGSYTLQATATDSTNLTATSSIQVFISNGNDLVGPDVDLSVRSKVNNTVLSEINFNAGETVYDKVELSVTAIDVKSSVVSLEYNGVSTLDTYDNDIYANMLGSPNGDNDTYKNDFDTTLLNDGDRVTFSFKAKDGANNVTTKYFSMLVQNTPAINSFTINSEAIGVYENVAQANTLGKTLTITNSSVLNLAWAVSDKQSDEEKLVRGTNCTAGNVVFSNTSAAVTSWPVSVNTLSTGDYVFCSVNRSSHLNGSSVSFYKSSQIIHINIDSDGDGYVDEVDVFDNDPAEHVDADGDGRGDASHDNCPGINNANQSDLDLDGRGDVCDNCIGVPNFDQVNTGSTDKGDACNNLLFGPSMDTYSVGNWPSAMTVADFNSDGYNDIAVANRDDNSVSVLLNHGNGSYVAVVNYSVGSMPLDITSVDLNHDGYIDIAAANSSGTSISILINTGSGAFSAAVSYIFGFRPNAITNADFNNDSYPDLATANNDGTVAVVLNMSGNGTFTNANIYTAHNTPQRIVSADFNNDGKIDVATLNSDLNFGSMGTISVLTNNGIGALANAVKYNLSGRYFPFDLFVSDLDGNGTEDLVSLCYFAEPDLVLLNSNGNFTFTDLNTGAQTISLRGGVATDLDGDDVVDLVAGGNGKTILLFGNGDGSFTPGAQMQRDVNKIRSVDVDNDGDEDLVILTTGNDSVSILYNNAF